MSHHAGKRLTLNELYNAIRKKRGKAKILASVIVGLGKDSYGNEVLAGVFKVYHVGFGKPH